MIRILGSQRYKIRFVCGTCGERIVNEKNEGLIFFNNNGELVRVVHRSTPDGYDCDNIKKSTESFMTVTDFINSISKRSK